MVAAADLSSNSQAWLQVEFLKESRLEMSLGCKDIPKMDVLSKSDPFCVVYKRVNPKQEWERFGATETVDDCSSCKWVRKFFLNPEILTLELRFEVYDRDSAREVLKDHDLIGYIEGKQILKVIEDPTRYGQIPLRRKGSKSTYGCICVTLDWIRKPILNFDATFIIGLSHAKRSKMYFQIMKKTENEDQYVPVFRSALLGKDETQFQPCTLKLSQLSAGSVERMFRIELFDFHVNGRSKVLGFVKTSMEHLLSLGPCATLTWNSCSESMERAKVFLSATQPGGSASHEFKISILE